MQLIRLLVLIAIVVAALAAVAFPIFVAIYQLATIAVLDDRPILGPGLVLLCSMGPAVTLAVAAIIVLQLTRLNVAVQSLVQAAGTASPKDGSK